MTASNLVITLKINMAHEWDQDALQGCDPKKINIIKDERFINWMLLLGTEDMAAMQARCMPGGVQQQLSHKGWDWPGVQWGTWPRVCWCRCLRQQGSKGMCQFATDWWTSHESPAQKFHSKLCTYSTTCVSLQICCYNTKMWNYTEESEEDNCICIILIFVIVLLCIYHVAQYCLALWGIVLTLSDDDLGSNSAFLPHVSVCISWQYASLRSS